MGSAERETEISRRQFLRGDFRARRVALRPPWSLTEARFLELCNGCGDCQRACPQKIISLRDGGYAEVDFAKGECTFCGDCARACAAGALQQTAGRAPWTLLARVGDDCLARRGVVCMVCGEQCATRAIQFPRFVGLVPAPKVDASACNGCGACVAPCPARAVSLYPQTEGARRGAPKPEASCT